MLVRCQGKIFPKNVPRFFDLGKCGARGYLREVIESEHTPRSEKIGADFGKFKFDSVLVSNYRKMIYATTLFTWKFFFQKIKALAL